VTAQPLVGWTVGVTADRRAGEQCELLQRAGASIVHAPSIRLVPLGADEAIRGALRAIVEQPPDLVVLTTGIGTRTLFEVADALALADDVLASFANADVIVRGPKAHGAAQTAGLEVAWHAKSATAAELVDHLAMSDVRGRRIAVQLDGREHPALGDQLRQLGADVVDVPVYRWRMPDEREPVRRLITAACEGRLDAMTFTSSPALLNLLEIAGCEREALLRVFDDSVHAVSIGRVCTTSARDVGILPSVEPARPRLGAMVRALSVFANHENVRRTTLVDGAPVTLHATTVVIDGEPIELPGRERAVLATLLARPRSVVSKTTLLQDVWPRGVDEHAAEVTITRLRRRLGPRLRIRSVPRRGYLLSTA
jgi:uroporphyrinogen-III synthase